MDKGRRKEDEGEKRIRARREATLNVEGRWRREEERKDGEERLP